jgi:Flp pilus assembly protein TadD
VAFEPNKDLTARVGRAVEAVLQRDGHLTYPALLCELGVLTNAQSIVRSGLGDARGCIGALRQALAVLPTYAPAILSMGSVQYQRGRRATGRRLLLSLLDLPDVTPDLCAIIDEAGDFLIQRGAYADGLELYRRAAARFPKMALFHQGVGCCAGHEGHHDETIGASRAALALEPNNQKFVNDLGWSLHQAGIIDEARATLERAVAMDPTDELAAENLRICRTPHAPGIAGDPPQASHVTAKARKASKAKLDALVAESDC